MKRVIGPMIVGLLLAGTVVFADPHGHGKQHRKEEHARGREHVVWITQDVQIVRDYYAPRYKNLPPGLRKKYARTGQLPPGWQKKMQPLPPAIEARCAPLPAGYHRGVIDAHAVIYDARGTVIDVAVLF
jgi:hypothetical protein